MTMVIAVAMAAVLTMVGTTLFTYTSANAKTSAASSKRMGVHAAAEGGLAEAAAVVANPLNNAYDQYLFCLDGAPAALPCQRTSTYGTVSVTWWGTLYASTSGAYWLLTAEASGTNPGATSPLFRRVRSTIPIYPKLTQLLANEAWNYIYSTKSASPVGTCDMTLQQSVSVASPLYVNGNLCLQNQASVTRGPLVVKGRLTLTTQANTVGSSSARISSAAIGNGCEWIWGRRLDTPCAGDVDNVWVQTGKLTTDAAALAAPNPLWNDWYLNASPGPYFPCLESSGIPPTFDSPVASYTASDAAKLAYKNDNIAAVNLTPAVSYSCKTASGELSWNATTRVLTVKGTMYIDGSAYIQNGAVNEYNGQATLYLSGTFLMKNSKLCGAVNAARTDCDFASWNPNTELLCIVANGSGGQLSSATAGIQLVSSTFEGAMQATWNIDTDTTSIADGPLVGRTVNLGQTVSTAFPTVTLVPAGMPSNPAVYGVAGAPSWAD